MRESEIERILTFEVKKLGGRAYKWVSPGNDGVPDRIVIFRDRTPVFVELKSEKGKLSPLQAVQIRRLEELGQRVEVVKGISGLADFFLEHGYADTAFSLRNRYDLWHGGEAR